MINAPLPNTTRQYTEHSLALRAMYSARQNGSLFEVTTRQLAYVNILSCANIVFDHKFYTVASARHHILYHAFSGDIGGIRLRDEPTRTPNAVDTCLTGWGWRCTECGVKPQTAANAATAATTTIKYTMVE
jgi:hypothetical protein